MVNKLKTAGVATSIFLMTAAAASAATLSLSTGGTSVELGSNFDPTPAVTLIGEGDTVTNFTNTFAGLGLSTDSISKVTITFLGKEAGYTNAAFKTSGGVQLLNTAVSGDSISFNQGAGLIGFSFETFGTDPTGLIANGVGASGTNASNLDMAFGDIFNNGKSVIALFGDGGANDDDDLDDMVVRIDVQPVPLPAAGFLLFGAIGGLAALRRRKKAAAA